MLYNGYSRFLSLSLALLGSPRPCLLHTTELASINLDGDSKEITGTLVTQTCAKCAQIGIAKNERYQSQLASDEVY